jgi:small subunit ribosomal protein S19e
MTTANDVPAHELIQHLAKKFEKEETIKMPEQNKYAKTSVAAENIPDNPDWWYIRCASIFRKIYMHNGIGIAELKEEYSGKRRRGSKPPKARAGSGTIVRRCVQQLEQAGFVTQIKGKGRIITPKGQKFMDNNAYDVKSKIVSSYPGLEKY